MEDPKESSDDGILRISLAQPGHETITMRLLLSLFFLALFLTLFLCRVKQDTPVEK